MDQNDDGALVEWQLMDGRDRGTPSLTSATATLTNTSPTWIFVVVVVVIIDAGPPQEEAGDKPPECVLVICIFRLELEGSDFQTFPLACHTTNTKHVATRITTDCKC
jgi:hypothetical protein